MNTLSICRPMNKTSLTFIVLFSFSTFAFGGQVKLVTGEFYPYSGSELTNGGMITALVTESLLAAHKKVDLYFLPWKRGLIYTLNHRMAATFPYVKDSQREAQYLFSESIFSAKVSLFVRRDSSITFSKDIDLKGLSTCVPLGYSTKEIQRFLTKGLIRVGMRPVTDSQCLKAVHNGNIDFYSVNELTGRTLARDLFGTSRALKTVGNPVSINNYHLIIAKDYPGGDKLLQAFNSGLNKIKVNGKYQRIVDQFISK